MAAATDRHEQVRLFAADIVERLERVGPVLHALASAAAEPELAELLRSVDHDRLDGLRRFVGVHSHFFLQVVEFVSAEDPPGSSTSFPPVPS